jgi:hypothetical protein
MTVQHVHVAEGGQAVVGNVNAPAEGVGPRKKSEIQPHALAYAPGVEMPRQIEAERATVPVAGDSGMHGAGGGAPKGNRNALKHGDFTAEGLALKREIQALARMTRASAPRRESTRRKRPWRPIPPFCSIG